MALSGTTTAQVGALNYEKDMLDSLNITVGFEVQADENIIICDNLMRSSRLLVQDLKAKYPIVPLGLKMFFTDTPHSEKDLITPLYISGATTAGATATVENGTITLEIIPVAQEEAAQVKTIIVGAEMGTAAEVSSWEAFYKKFLIINNISEETRQQLVNGKLIFYYD